MQIEENSTQCPNCKNNLTWKSHVKRYEQTKLRLSLPRPRLGAQFPHPTQPPPPPRLHRRPLAATNYIEGLSLTTCLPCITRSELSILRWQGDLSCSILF